MAKSKSGEVKKGDFVKLDFVGRIKATNQIFDLTMKDVAKKEGLETRSKLKPMIACLGSKQLIKGFDEQIIGKKTNQEFEFDVPAKKAFGNKHSNLIKLTSLSLLKKRGVNPVKGMQLNVDNSIAVVRSVSGGRVTLDFNHPLAGKDLHYRVKLHEKIKDPKKKIEAIADISNIKCDVSINKDTARVKFGKDTKKQAKDFFKSQVKKHVSEIKAKFD